VVARINLRHDQLRKVRRWVGLTTDAALAARMGIDPGNLSRVLNGRQAPSSGFIAAMCAALDAEFDDLFEVVAEGRDVA